jgi:hypothetical protein
MFDDGSEILRSKPNRQQERINWRFAEVDVVSRPFSNTDEVSVYLQEIHFLIE